MNNYIVKSPSFHPHYNLALEEYLMETVQGAALYLWQNQNTVVIGRNQNPWRECRLELLQSEGGVLARRPSGGGAVFHDLGNLCFSFILPTAAYDLERQLGVILAACRAQGIQAAFSGRNDLIAGGRKFSGNAFKLRKDVCLQHGTLLVSVDMDKLSRYLAPPPDKIESKGIESVRARVCNLADLAPVTVESLQAALLTAFEREYGPAQALAIETLDTAAIAAKQARFASDEWRLAHTPRFDAELSARFAWGGITLLLQLERGIVACATSYSDAMDDTLPPRIAEALTGAAYGPALGVQLSQRLSDPKAQELARLLRERAY